MTTTENQIRLGRALILQERILLKLGLPRSRGKILAMIYEEQFDFITPDFLSEELGIKYHCVIAYISNIRQVIPKEFISDARDSDAYKISPELYDWLDQQLENYFATKS